MTMTHVRNRAMAPFARIRIERSGGPYEYIAVLTAAAALFLFLCLATYDPKDPSFNVVTDRATAVNLCGLVGSFTADALVQA